MYYLISKVCLILYVLIESQVPPKGLLKNHNEWMSALKTKIRNLIREALGIVFIIFLVAKQTDNTHSSNNWRY